VEREASPHAGRRPSTGGFHGREDNYSRGNDSTAVRISSSVMPSIGVRYTPPVPQAKHSPRRVAVRTLREIEQRQGFSNRILSEQLERHAELDRRDRGLVTTLVYGVLRNQTRLDTLIDAAADKPHKLKGELRTILRVAVFELIELERPLAIANAEAGKLARRIDPHGRLGKLITGILHAVARDWQARESALSEPLEQLVRRWSLPPWLAARWIEQLGPDRALARARALARVPTVDLRVDLHRSNAESVRAALRLEQPSIEFVELHEAAGEQPQCLRVRGGGDLFFGPTFEAGLFSIQSLGSQQAVRVLDPQPGERVLDACAGMGTKTVQIAEQMRRRGTIVAVDTSQERLDELELARERAALGGELTLHTIASPLHDAPLEQGFDAILLDAPCTGLGNLGRHPELRSTSSPESIDACRTTQADLLLRCATLLRPGGRLVYAVCSLEPEEGERIVANFLAAEPGREFALEQSHAWTPEEHDTDGFWLARLRARGRFPRSAAKE
jgi:16S rRNA (cytosine967-C5)-methyltransferase